jgi:hypothetical protein
LHTETEVSEKHAAYIFRVAYYHPTTQIMEAAFSYEKSGSANKAAQRHNPEYYNDTTLMPLFVSYYVFKTKIISRVLRFLPVWQ